MRDKVAEPANPTIEKLVSKIAREQALSARWYVYIVIVTYAMLIIVLLLGLKGIAFEIVTLIAISGLAVVLLMERLRRRKLHQHSHNHELKESEEVLQEDKYEVAIQSPLSERETQILNYAKSGHINKQIAIELGISEYTVKNHFTHIFEKLGATDRTQAVVMAIEHRWVSSNGNIIGSRILGDKYSNKSSSIHN